MNDKAPLSNAATLRRLTVLALIPAVMIGLWAAGASEFLSLERLFERRAWLRRIVDDHWLEAAAAYAALHILAASLAVPRGPLAVGAGFLFGLAPGAIMGVVCATAGASLLFLAARSGLRLARLDRAGPRLERLRAGFNRDAWSWLLFMRLTPLFPFALATLSAAAFGARLSTLAWTTLVGVAPAALAWATAGAGLETALAAQAQAFDACLAAGGNDCRLDFSLASVLTPTMLAAFAAMACLALIPVIARRWRSSTVPGTNA